MAGDIHSRAGWRIRGTVGELVILSRKDASSEDIAKAMPVSSGQIESWLSDPLVKPVLIDICRLLGISGFTGGTVLTPHDRRRLKQALEEAFRTRVLVAIKSQSTRRSQPGGSEETAPAEAPSPPSRSDTPVEKTYIEIVLKDRRGRPRSKEAFQITLPDGSVFKGKLDDGGSARKDGIDPGNCVVMFPELGRVPL